MIRYDARTGHAYHRVIHWSRSKYTISAIAAIFIEVSNFIHLSLFSWNKRSRTKKYGESYWSHLAGRIADGDAVRIPYNIDTPRATMEVLVPPGPTDIQAKLTMGGGDIGCGEFGLCQLNSLANAVLLYNAEYVTKYKHERGGQPNQNGMATLLFGDDMHSSSTEPLWWRRLVVGNKN